MIKTIFPAILFIVNGSVYRTTAQDRHLIDSLHNQLLIHNTDTIAADISDKLSRAYWNNNLDSAMKFAGQTLNLSVKTGYKKGIGNAYNSFGVVTSNKGDFLKALEFHKKALSIRELINDREGIAWCHNNMGSVYYRLGNYPESLKHYFIALKIFDETGNKLRSAYVLVNIGSIYQKQGNYTEALRNNFASLKIDKEFGDKKATATCLNNIGIIYKNQDNYQEALRVFLESLKISEEINDRDGIARTYSNMGVLYVKQNKFKEALKNYFASLSIREELKDKNGIALTLGNIGEVYVKEGNYHDASGFLSKALSLSKEMGALEWMKNCYINMSNADSATGNLKQALEHYKLYIETRDSLLNNENTKKTMQVQLQYEFDKKESLAKAEQEKKDALALKELQKQKLVRNGFMGGFVVVLLFAGVFFTQRNKIKAGKKRSDELLLNILPEEVAEELKQKGSAEAKQFDEVTVMFTDFKGFTQLSEKLSPAELVAEIHTCFKAFDEIISRHHIEKIKTIGDSYMCAGGLPVANTTNATDVVNAALEIQQFMQQHLQQRKSEGKEPFEIRIGIHTGPVVAGIVGMKKFAYDIWGDTVNIASRMESSGEVGRVNISGNTYELVKDTYNCIYRGKIQAKNKGETDMYFVNPKS